MLLSPPPFVVTSHGQPSNDANAWTGPESGAAMSYEFGTSRLVFSVRAAIVIGPLMAYGVLTAFFLLSRG